MTSPSPQGMHTAQANALLRVRMEELTAAYEWMSEQTTRIHAEMAKLTGKAESRDGMVKATVGQGGTLVALELDPRSSRRVSTEELSVAIIETVNRATKDAGTRAAALAAPLLPAGALDKDASAVSDPATWLSKMPMSEETFDAWWSTIRKDAKAPRP
jgi:DNA-binding protein YbaB